MKKSKIKIVLITLIFICTQIILSYGQNHKVFETVHPASTTININQNFSKTTTFTLIDQNASIYSFGINAKFQLYGYKSFVRVVLVTEKGHEYLVLESNYMLNNTNEVSISNYGEETALLNGDLAKQIKIVIENASLHIESIVINNSNTSKKSDIEYSRIWNLKKQNQDSVKIERITKRNKDNGQSWIAGKTELSELTFSQKKKVFGDPLPNLRGFEYYNGGVMDLTEPTMTKSASQVQSTVISTFDWRDRHGEDWNTSAKNQGQHNTCALFAAVGVTEALINLYYNQHLDIDLAEQKPVICGWSRLSTLDHFTSTGAVYESCAPYNPDNGQTCDDVCPNPSEIIKIGGRESLHAYEYPYTEDGYKKMLIKHGPNISGMFSLNHNMVMVGYSVDNTDGKTIWIFKNSYGNSIPYYSAKTDVSDLWGAYAPLPPVTFVNSTYTDNDIVCIDSDGDGYYNWGIGSKPSTCPTCRDEADGDDSNSNLGPLNEFGYCAHLICGNQTWQSVNNEYADVFVKNGGSLTLNGATINLANNASFVVEVGGSLIFNSGSIQ